MLLLIFSFPFFSPVSAYFNLLQLAHESYYFAQYDVVFSYFHFFLRMSLTADSKIKKPAGKAANAIEKQVAKV